MLVSGSVYNIVTLSTYDDLGETAVVPTSDWKVVCCRRCYGFCFVKLPVLIHRLRGVLSTVYVRQYVCTCLGTDRLAGGIFSLSHKTCLVRHSRETDDAPVS